MGIVEDLQHLAEEELCLECRTPLTEEEMEQGYVCLACIHGWIDEALNEH